MTAFSNTEYLYQHLPSRFRGADTDLFLKRYVQWFGETLDGYDQAFDDFADNINPETASEIWVEFWLANLFGWSWFPEWFTLAEKRRLYGNFARHLARRGTAAGIQEWLKDFTVITDVQTRPQFCGEFIWGEPGFTISEPLLIAVETMLVEPRGAVEMSAVGDSFWGEALYTENVPLFTEGEFQSLLQFVQPQAQEILLIRRLPQVKELPLAGYILLPGRTRRALNKNFAQLPDVLNFERTLIKDLSENSVLSGYPAAVFTVRRTLNAAIADLEDVIDFLNTVVADYSAGRSFAGYTLTNFRLVRTVNSNAGELEHAIHLAQTIALDLGALI